MAIGWEVKFIDEMQYSGSQDLVDTAPNTYEYVLRADNGNQMPAPLVISGDLVESDLSRGSLSDDSVLVLTRSDDASPNPGPDVSPDEEFSSSNCDTDGGTERNLWTAVHDFVPKTNVSETSIDGHPSIMIRVNPFTNSEGRLDYERFGAFVSPKGPSEDQSASLPELALEFIFQGKDGLTYAWIDGIDLPSGDNPFENVDTLYRIQVQERLKWTGFSYRLEWNAELWKDPGGASEDLIASHGWKTADDVKNNAKSGGQTAGSNYDLPPLAHSRLIFGFGTGLEGVIHTTRVGSAFWNYGSTSCL